MNIIQIQSKGFLALLLVRPFQVNWGTLEVQVSGGYTQVIWMFSLHSLSEIRTVEKQTFVPKKEHNQPWKHQMKTKDWALWLSNKKNICNRHFIQSLRVYTWMTAGHNVTVPLKWSNLQRDQKISPFSLWTALQLDSSDLQEQFPVQSVELFRLYHPFKPLNAAGCFQKLQLITISPC